MEEGKKVARKLYEPACVMKRPDARLDVRPVRFHPRAKMILRINDKHRVSEAVVELVNTSACAWSTSIDIHIHAAVASAPAASAAVAGARIHRDATSSLCSLIPRRCSFSSPCHPCSCLRAPWGSCWGKKRNSGGDRCRCRCRCRCCFG